MYQNEAFSVGIITAIQDWTVIIHVVTLFIDKIQQNIRFSKHSFIQQKRETATSNIAKYLDI